MIFEKCSFKCYTTIRISSMNLSKITSKLVSNFCPDFFFFDRAWQISGSRLVCMPFFSYLSHVRSSVITSTNMWMTNCRKHLFHPYNYFQKQWKLLFERLQSTGRGSELNWCKHFQHTLFTLNRFASPQARDNRWFARLECPSYVTSSQLTVAGGGPGDVSLAYYCLCTDPRCFASEETGSKNCSNFVWHGIVFCWFSVSIHVGLQIFVYCWKEDESIR